MIVILNRGIQDTTMIAGKESMIILNYYLEMMPLMNYGAIIGVCLLKVK